jgi:hypothetical protein
VLCLRDPAKRSRTREQIGSIDSTGYEHIYTSHAWHSFYKFLEGRDRELGLGGIARTSNGNLVANPLAARYERSQTFATCVIERPVHVGRDEKKVDAHFERSRD